MIIVNDQITGKYEWFNEKDANSFIYRWQTDEEIMYFTTKTRQFVLVNMLRKIEVDGEEKPVKRAEKKFPEGALFWLVNRGFDPPDCLKAKFIREDNEI